MLTIADFSAPKSFLVSLCCSLAAYFIFKILKRNKDENTTLLIFWCSSAVFYIILGISTLVFYFNQWLSFQIYYLCLIFAGVQMFVGVFYLIQKIIIGKKVRVVIGIILMILFVIYSFASIKNAQPTVRYGEPILELGSGTPQGYLGAIMILVIIVFALFSFRKDLKKGIVSWGKMGEFYKFYAFIIYMAISLIRILYFLPHPWYLEAFYLLIPYLSYKSYKETT